MILRLTDDTELKTGDSVMEISAWSQEYFQNSFGEKNFAVPSKNKKG